MCDHRRRPPTSEPSTPRKTSRPTCDPIERAALFAAASSMPSWRPPRGPLDPISMPPSTSSTPPLAGVVALGASAFALELSMRVCAAAFSFSYADSRSTVCS